MKVVVTGARGFVGRHVLTELEKRDVDVVATTRLGNRYDLPTRANLRWVELDIKKSPEKCFQKLGAPDVLIHLAWTGLPNYQSLHHFETELPHQYNFLSALIREGLSSLVITGTCFEYGMQSGPLSANTQTSPTNPYGFAKDALRKQLEYLKKTHPFKLTWARLFYLYGEGQPETSLFPMLEKAVTLDQSTFQMSSGEQLRDYLPVTKAARALVDLALAGHDTGVVNVCSGVPISVRRLVEGWIQERGWKIKPELEKLPYPDYEPMAFWGVSSRQRQILGDDHANNDI